jgi:4-amino-4-deoxy-L-arabinose transferase-like glycosyltransferase
MPKLSRTQIIFLVIFVLSTILRFWEFPNIPVGLNQDEASATVEAKAILETGADRWGIPFPVYFPVFGSGMNSLLTYLTVPFVALFGVNIFATRIVSELLGLIAIYCCYKFVKNISTETNALIATGLLAFLPWHFMASRWGLESNMLPPLMIIGMSMISQTLIKGGKWIYFCLLPLALAIYGYGTGITVVPILLVLIFAFNYKEIMLEKRKWLISLGLFFITFAPLGLFILKNYVTKVNYDFEKYLPFTAKLLNNTRLDEVGSDRLGTIISNYEFVLNGMKDGLPWNTSPGFGTIPEFLFLFFFIGLAFIIYTVNKDTSNKLNLLLSWLVANLGCLALIPANVNRINTIFIPIIITIGLGIGFIYDKIDDLKFKKVYALGVFIPILIFSWIFYTDYFTKYPDKYHFPRDLEQPFAEVVKLNQKTLITGRLPINYIFVLYYTDFPIKQFQKEAAPDAKNNDYSVRKFGNYYLDENLIKNESKNDKSFAFLYELNETVCNNEQITFKNKDYKVGVCRN